MTSIPYGHWPSPITPELLTTQGVRISEPQAVGERLYWLESRPQEKGRNALVYESNGVRSDLLAAPHSIRTRAHEYGGAPYLATDHAIFYVLDIDQRIYRFDCATEEIRALTPEGNYRYADFCYDATCARLIAVREDCTKDAHHPESTIIALNVINDAIEILAQGADFYSNPRLSPNANQLSFLRWNHPNMPWDGTECVVAELNPQGKITHTTVIAGGTQESIFQPQWSTTGELFFVSDHNNWWNIYRWDGVNSQIIYSATAEFAMPQWVFGMSCYGFLSPDEILCCFSQQGFWQLGVIHIANKTLNTVESDLRDISGIHCHKSEGYFIAASSDQGAQLWRYADKTIAPLTKTAQAINTHFIAAPLAIEFPTRDGESAHGFFYAPTNPDIEQPSGQLPPLLVMLPWWPNRCDRKLAQF